MPSTAAELHVAVGILRDDRDRVLLTRRHAASHQGGLWEFPGGKVEEGESLSDALRRELREELGVDVRSHRPLLDVRHDYGDRRVRLDVHEVLEHGGEPQPLEGQPMRWASAQELEEFRFPAANLPIVEALLRNSRSQRGG